MGHYAPPSSRWDQQTRDLLRATGVAFDDRAFLVHGRRPTGQSALCYPDLTFRAERLAVFLDGCYWHGCPDHYPHRAVGYDRTIDSGLAAAGWKVVRIWEHVKADVAAAQIASLVGAE